MEIANKYGNIFKMASLLSAIKWNESNFEKKNAQWARSNASNMWNSVENPFAYKINVSFASNFSKIDNYFYSAWLRYFVHAYIYLSFWISNQFKNTIELIRSTIIFFLLVTVNVILLWCYLQIYKIKTGQLTRMKSIKSSCL